jgi:hypothetical protein
VPFGLPVITTDPLPQQPELHSLRYYAVGDEVPLGRFIRTLASSASWSRSCSNPGPSSLYWPKATSPCL